MIAKFAIDKRIPIIRPWLAIGFLLLGLGPVCAQVQHPLAAHRIRVHRVHTHRTNVASAVHDHRQDVAGAIHDRRVDAVDRVQDHRQDIADTRQARAENIAAHRTAVAARAILPSYVPATIAPSGSITVPPAPVTLTEPAPPPAAQKPSGETGEDEGLSSDELPDQFEGSPSYPVVRLEDGGITAVLKVGQGETKVRMVGVTAVALGDRVNVPERFAGLRLPSTERYVDNILKGESVYVVYDTRVAEEDTDKKCVAYIFRAPDGLLVNLEVIRAGFAVVDTRYDFDQKETFAKYQNSAQKAEKGIYGIVQRINASRAEKQKAK
ncbi:MAG TPA: thermonuclease family protein [Verrucomicrobiae bacterium]|nr:thermonuclease family protein [Verrucomicrobiae bacterium]